MTPSTPADESLLAFAPAETMPLPLQTCWAIWITASAALWYMIFQFFAL